MRMPNAWAMAEGTKAGSSSGARETKYAPSRKLSSSRWASSRLRRVLPTPFGLTIVTRRMSLVCINFRKPASSFLEDARARGWKLAILSNTDRDYIDASLERIGVPFELSIVASEIGSYKPGHRHWEAFFERTDADRAGHVHVGASLFHDIEPARALGLRTVWINRLGEEPEPQPDVELHTLAGLGGALDGLVSG